MSASLLEIRGRIKSVKNTRKITKAMKLVAASKMKQFQKKALSSRDFASDLLNILNTELHAQTQDNIFTKSHEKGKTMFILYTSDKGLCGGYNVQLTKKLDSFVQGNEDSFKFYFIGKKAKAPFIHERS